MSSNSTPLTRGRLDAASPAATGLASGLDLLAVARMLAEEQRELHAGPTAAAVEAQPISGEDKDWTMGGRGSAAPHAVSLADQRHATVAHRSEAQLSEHGTEVDQSSPDPAAPQIVSFNLSQAITALSGLPTILRLGQRLPASTACEDDEMVEWISASAHGALIAPVSGATRGGGASLTSAERPRRAGTDEAADDHQAITDEDATSSVHTLFADDMVSTGDFTPVVPAASTDARATTVGASLDASSEIGQISDGEPLTGGIDAPGDRQVLFPGNTLGATVDKIVNASILPLPSAVSNELETQPQVALPTPSVSPSEAVGQADVLDAQLSSADPESAPLQGVVSPPSRDAGTIEPHQHHAGIHSDPGIIFDEETQTSPSVPQADLPLAGAPALDEDFVSEPQVRAPAEAHSGELVAERPASMPPNDKPGDSIAPQETTPADLFELAPETLELAEVALGELIGQPPAFKPSDVEAVDALLSRDPSPAHLAALAPEAAPPTGNAHSPIDAPRPIGLVDSLSGDSGAVPPDVSIDRHHAANAQPIEAAGGLSFAPLGWDPAAWQPTEVDHAYSLGGLGSPPTVASLLLRVLDRAPEADPPLRPTVTFEDDGQELVSGTAINLPALDEAAAGGDGAPYMNNNPALPDSFGGFDDPGLPPVL